MQYAITVALHHQEISDYPERISKIKPFINNYDWKDINYPSGIDDWKNVGRNNKNIALNILSASPNKKKKLSYTNHHIIISVKNKLYY